MRQGSHLTVEWVIGGQNSLHKVSKLPQVPNAEPGRKDGLREPQRLHVHDVFAGIIQFADVPRCWPQNAAGQHIDSTPAQFANFVYDVRLD
jgi:hypothetical protein